MDKKKILIIEDDKSLVDILSDALGDHNYSITMSLTANEGLEKAINNQPDLIVLDILLPENNGFECLRNLKEHPKTKDIPVVILSNLGQEEEIRQGIAIGAVDYIVKANSDMDEIAAKINQYMQ